MEIDPDQARDGNDRHDRHKSERALSERASIMQRVKDKIRIVAGAEPTIDGMAASCGEYYGTLWRGCIALAICSLSLLWPPVVWSIERPHHDLSSNDPPSQAALELHAGDYIWMPELAPQGPVVIVISLPEQRAYVYRNGVRIGISTVSTGKSGYETPTGVFSILEKSREHYSNLYDDAPMPFMQRLTWDGVALHAGDVPAYPASHGCVRLPYAFSEKLFSITSRGMTVVIADEVSHARTVTSPGLFAPVDPASGQPRSSEDVSPDMAYSWTPERATQGPLTIVLSSRDREVVILRDAIEIGRAAVSLNNDAALPAGTQVYILLEGRSEGASAILPDRPALRWMAIPMPSTAKAGDSKNDLMQVVARGDLNVEREFARQVYDALQPGTTIVITDESIRDGNQDDELTVIRADEPTQKLVDKPLRSK